VAPQPKEPHVVLNPPYYVEVLTRDDRRLQFTGVSFMVWRKAQHSAPDALIIECFLENERQEILTETVQSVWSGQSRPSWWSPQTPPDPPAPKEPEFPPEEPETETETETDRTLPPEGDLNV
jgi:hypothetical protein